MARTPKPSGRERRKKGLDSVSRRAPFRQIRARILIVCEGEKTEPNYFHALRRMLKLGSVAVVIDDTGGDTSPEQITTYAVKQKLRDGGYDEVWCVFDTEAHHTRNTIRNALDIAKRHQIRPAASNPAFEYWFLLHFEYTDRPFADASAVISVLKKHLPDYEKDYRNCEVFLEHVEIAVEHATQVLDNHAEGGFAPNPSTYVHRLVEKLLGLSLHF